MKVKVSKDMLKMHLFNAIDKMPDESFAQFAQIALCATGVTDMDGSLTKKYQGKPVSMVKVMLGISEEQVFELVGESKLVAHMFCGEWIITNDSIKAYKESK